MKRSELVVGAVLALKGGRDWGVGGDEEGAFSYKMVKVVETSPYRKHSYTSELLKVTSGSGVLVQVYREDGEPYGLPTVVQLGKLVGPFDEIHAQQQALREQGRRKKNEEKAHNAELDRKAARVRSVFPSAIRVNWRMSIDIFEALRVLEEHGLLPKEESDETE